MSPMVSGWLTRRSYSWVAAPGSGLVVEVRDELARLPGPPARRHPLDVEVGDAEGERLHHRRVEEAAGGEVVVLGEVVGEAVVVAVEQDHAALVAEEAADGDADEDHDHREVEEQVAGLAEVAALGSDRVGALLPLHPEPTALHHRGGARQHDVRRLVGGVRRALRQPREVPRRPWGPGPQRAGVDEQARDDAAHQRDHQQDVDRGEPRRAVDREEVEPVPDGREAGVVVAPLRDRQRVDVLLREDRARDGREREQQQEHERRTHRGQLAPRPPGELAGVEVVGQRGGLPGVGGPGERIGHNVGSNPWTTWSCSQPTSTSHHPVTSSSPTTIIIAPPTRMTATWWRRTTAKARSIRR